MSLSNISYLHAVETMLIYTQWRIQGGGKGGNTPPRSKDLKNEERDN